MDLNASPLPEEDDDIFDPHLGEDNAQEEHVHHNDHVELAESAVEISRRVPSLLFISSNIPFYPSKIFICVLQVIFLNRIFFS